MSVRTVKVSNVSLRAAVEDLKEFFSFSGDVEYIEMNRGDEKSQVAYVTFKKPQEADTALLLSGATIGDLIITISPAIDYQVPAVASNPCEASDGAASSTNVTIQKAENVISSMLAKGIILGKDALQRAKSFDEKHRLTSTAITKASNLDQKMKLSEKISTGTSAVNEKVLEIDNKYQVSDKAKSAIAVAEQKVTDAGSAAMKNKYVSTGVSWMMGAVDKVTKTASEVGTMAVEKAAAAEQQRKKSAEEDDPRKGDSSVNHSTTNP